MIFVHILEVYILKVSKSQDSKENGITHQLPARSGECEEQSGKLPKAPEQYFYQHLKSSQGIFRTKNTLQFWNNSKKKTKKCNIMYYLHT